MVRGDQQKEGTRGKDQGSLQASTVAPLTDKISTMDPGQKKKLLAPPFSNRREGTRKRQLSEQQKEKNQ